MTLYTLTNNGNAVACTGPCATIWPPLTAAPGTTPVAPGVTSIGTSASPTGSQLVTHKGLPLYRFSGDTTPGTTNGEGVDTFGGEWHVVKVAAGPTAAPGAVGAGNANTTPKPSTGSYGY
jgi:predicted lipoprotein with Yx(FWY)xxD motif